MASTFTPSKSLDMSKERDWPASIGMMDWDSTSVVFTKRSLIEFLKYTGTTVDPNFSNIAKLPRYATFGKMTDAPPDAGSNIPEITSQAGIATNPSDEFKPTRRVRTVPGGPHTDIFSHDVEDDALSTAPPKPEGSEPVTSPNIPEAPVVPEEESGINFTSTVKPSRRVRTGPGGHSSMANFWDPEESPEDFKPTRRVRQGPGGQDHMNEIF
ncbi:hypothetical protein BD779DRAFT_1510447 [Infundibulicybe gibba]|nr:hypothetical protein BD779DRAFT_1510447 [Infundibulicybe gibba]